MSNTTEYQLFAKRRVGRMKGNIVFDCYNAIVYEEGEVLMVRCSKGHPINGRKKVDNLPLSNVLGGVHPIVCANCPDRDSGEKEVW